ncbi:MAG: four helix bundle protein [Chitinophagaceae bacterium]|nr:four helix bundle protein [Chitinophagaceae bacterium]
MAKVTQFEDLEIWKLARIQSNEIWKICSKGKFAHDYELRNQINRSTGSVMDNIAEGFERTGNKEFINFLIIAKGSNGEVQSQLHRALDRRYLTEDEFNNMMEKSLVLSKKITALIIYLRNSPKKGYRYS